MLLFSPVKGDIVQLYNIKHFVMSHAIITFPWYTFWTVNKGFICSTHTCPKMCTLKVASLQFKEVCN